MENLVNQFDAARNSLSKLVHLYPEFLLKQLMMLPKLKLDQLDDKSIVTQWAHSLKKQLEEQPEIHATYQAETVEVQTGQGQIYLPEIKIYRHGT